MKDSDRADLEYLANLLVGQAKEHLAERHAFAPFAGEMSSDGEVSLSMTGDGELAAGEMVAQLVQSLAARSHELRAAAVCYDGRLPAQNCDAIICPVETTSESIQMCLPYRRLESGAYSFEQPIWSRKARQFFDAPEAP